MNTSNIAAVTEALTRARHERRTVDSASYADVLGNAAEAYAVQSAVAQSLGWQTPSAGRYWKSGGSSRDAELTHAALPPAGVWGSPADAGSWPFTWRGIEAEIALRLGCDVDAALAAKLDYTAAAELIDAMTVSIEIVDSRWGQYINAPPLLKLADLQSHGALVLGDWQAFEPRDWAAQRCRVQIAQKITERCGTHALGDPAFCLPAWLRHATREDRVVEAGSVVTTGTWVGILDAAVGDLVTVVFEGVGHASVQL
ncbi:fumarylacetoacetate hydrolase family protein [Collimonas antrihumi]|uniref:fumarylacetoacetate hydrolase family protein n=1 Tax=Collimonas antrihumi TaxID=1940615 RepID=UPI001B8B9655|nr:fumarylacetoacetate hydrolase family protein [Collimonas antrihumi]